VKYLGDDLALLHNLVECGKVRCHAVQVQHVVLDGLPIFEHGEVILLTELLCHHLLHTVVADPHSRDRVLGLLSRLLLGNRRHHLRWYYAT
jgi:hypothetical protein